MSDPIYPFILAIIFLMHNYEEWLSFDSMPKFSFIKKYFHRKAFLFAISVLSVLVTVFSFPYFQKMHLIILFALTINALQHCFLSIWHRKLIPGTFSALFFMLPFSLFCLIKLFQEGALDFPKFIKYLILSPIVMIISIGTTLFIGSKLFKNKH